MATCQNIIADEISDEIMDHKLSLAFGDRMTAKDWSNKILTVEELLNKLTFWRIGPKDGPCFIQGHLGAGAGVRQTQYVDTCDIVMVDMDTGMSIDKIKDHIRDAGLFAVLWTTSSHLRPSTTVPEKTLETWLKRKGEVLPYDDADLLGVAVDYLQTEKRMESALFPMDGTDACSLTREMTDKGVAFVITHLPCPRTRALFVLNETWSFMKGGTKRERDDAWKRGYAAFSTKLGLPYDRTCVDPARLMYLPSMPVGGDISKHELHVINGDFLDLEAQVMLAPLREYDNPFTAEFDAGHKHKSPTTGERFRPKTPGLLEFVAKYPDFDPIAMLQTFAPDDFRGRNNTDTKIEFMCPYEDGHSSADPEQVPFFVSIENGSWYMGCQTDGCKGNSNGDRLYFLDALLRKYDIQVGQLGAFSATFQAERVAADIKEKKTETDKATLYDSLTPQSSSDDVARCLKNVLAHGSLLERDRLLSIVQKKTGIKLPALKNEMKRIENAEKQDSDAADSSANNGAPPPPEDLSKAHTIWPEEWGWEVTVKAAKARLSAVNQRKPRIFARPEGGAKVRLCETPERIYPEDMRADAWDAEISESMCFMGIDNNGNRRSLAPPRMLRPVLSGTDELSIPLLRGITRVAIPADDGSMPGSRGYHAPSATFFDPNYTPRALPATITDTDVDEAVGWIVEALRDFPFSDAFDGNDLLPVKTDDLDADGFRIPNWERGKSSRAHAITMLLQPFARNFIKGPCPAYHIDKASPGTGAGYLANVLYTIMTGKTAQPMTMSNDNEEFGKAVTATLREGEPLIFIDNINRHVDSDVLASALTTGYWKGRVLGRTEMVNVPINATWIMAGNNLTFSHELMRRLIPIRMDAAVSDPARNRGAADFKHFPLQAWLESHRADLIWSLQVIVKHWIQQGCPLSKHVVNSFDSWSTVMGGILNAAGVEGFLDSIPAYQNTKDDDRAYIQTLITEGVNNFKDNAYSASDLFNRLAAAEFDDFLSSLPINGHDEAGKLKSFGKLLNKHLVGGTFDIPLDTLKQPIKVEWPIHTDKEGLTYYRVKCVKMTTRNSSKYKTVGI